MKTIRLLTAFLSITLAATAVAAATDYVQADHPSSFRGIEWKTDKTDIPDLLAITKAGYKDSYFRQNEKLTFGDAEIQSVAYYFRKNKLYRVGIAFTGRSNQFLLKEQLISMYGMGRNAGSRYGWMWPDFSIELSYDDDNKLGALYFTYEGDIEK